MICYGNEMDIFSPTKRSSVMACVHSKDTTPELTVRRYLHNLGYRFRLHRKDLPGKPDIVLPKYHSVIFIHGCFWHRHEGCKRASFPATNQEFWSKKFDNNIKRDEKNIQALLTLGWRVTIIWECEIKNMKYIEKVERFLSPH